ncbi:MAG TPA: energy transducer TonB, partial [Candidatus Acidoferrales bacterium]|nr:energy transducer TonB [Candidatus Acidoferrales bacterium]
QLTSTGGDLVLHLPRKLAATIDARIEQSNGHRIFADPSLPVQISAQDSAQTEHAIRYAVRFNGGGEVLHLRAVSGNIVLRASDPEIRSGAAGQAGWTQRGDASAALESVSSRGGEEFTDADGFFAEVRRRILESWWGAIPVEPEEMQKHLEHSVAPAYPDVARQAGIEGEVILRVYVSSDGRVSDIKVLDGPPILARAAVQAVQQWRYQAPRMNGRPANVVATLVVSFRLH